MNEFLLESGRRYYCQTSEDGGQNRGVFSIEEGDIRLSFVNFEAPFNFQVSKEFFLIIERGWIVSFLDAIAVRSRTTHGVKAHAYTSDFVSNTSLVGWDKWEAKSAVRRLWFRLIGFENIFKNSNAFRLIKKERNEDQDERLIFDVRWGTRSIRAWFSATWVGMSVNAENITPWIEISFDDEVDLTVARGFMDEVVRFFCCCSGALLRPSEINVSRYTEVQSTALTGALIATSNHRLFHYFRNIDTNRQDAELFKTIGGFWKTEIRVATEAALVAWLDRSTKWQPAANMQMLVLRERESLSGSRLLAAARWIEEIPGTASKPTVTKYHVRALGKLVSNVSVKLGYGPLGGRFKNAISKISQETNRERCTRLVNKVRGIFGGDIVADDMIDWLSEAFRIRNTLAHGAIKESSEIESVIFELATYLIECICTLLMLADLPFDDEQRQRVCRHPFVDQYRNGAMGKSPAFLRAQSNG